ncbi:mechanosensitive ion channel family protein [Bacillus aquiflavi]|uniref:Mechanosensitive ion channel family protein n=2 Tax=Bacillus aquiflavi TaxID=2672567 RepID=A0A6B3VSC9_9BACI|nr:mechanosensitive ion channel family protein [Bacillus aquiflavi]MBA4536502.1 mechanosensitive ion channel family protein [Bacillus aquiflavi]NEY80869.1 mechanosensitive ion channel family protein [Bacillus aquiflavi]
MSFVEKYLTYDTLVKILITIGIFLLFVIFRKIFAKYIFKIILRLSKKTPTDFFTHLLTSFENPIRWFFIIIGIYLSARYFPYFNHENPLFLKLMRSSLIVLVIWGLYNFSSSSSLLFRKLNNRLNIEIDQMLIPFLSKTIRFIIIAIGISMIAEEFGYDVNKFIAGLGLGGLAVALAAKDALGNLFGGVVIITEKPFSIGDWIMTPSVEGTVEEISFRSTRVRTFAQALVTVPNATLAVETITNWSKMGKRRISFHLGLTYDTPKEKIEKIVRRIEELLRSHPDIHQETIFVKFDQFNESSLDIFLYFFTKTTNWGDFLTIKEEINFKIMDIIEEEEASIAFPSRTLYVSSDSETKAVKDRA